jgi:hypothetical protein
MPPAVFGNVEVRFCDDGHVDGEALQQVEFDVESLDQVSRAHGDPPPRVWLARPAGYVAGGHVLRDSDAIRLVAGSADSGVLCATDGCNTCRHELERPLGQMSAEQLATLAARTQIPLPLLSGLVET